MTGEKTYSGQCYCGHTKVTVQGEPLASGYCHCASCRSFHGSPFIGWCVWPSEAVSFSAELRGTTKNPSLARSTCAECGGKIAGVLKDAGMTVVFPSVLAGSGLEFQPQMHKYYEDRVVDIADGVPKFVDGPEAFGGSGEMVPELRGAG